MSAGVLNNVQLGEVLFNPKSDCWVPRPEVPLTPDGSAIDLPLGTRFWKMRGSCRPNPEVALVQLRESLKESGPHPLEKDTVFEVGKVYWVELACEKLALPEEIHGRCTAKSTVGRLDAMVRVLSDREDEFDKISPQRGHNIILEVVPISFGLQLSPGTSLSQLRLLKGDEGLCTMPARALFLESDHVLLTKECNPYRFEPFADDPLAVPLSLDLSNDIDCKCCGFEAVSPSPAIAIDPSKADQYDPAGYWAPVHTKNGFVKIAKDRFYIFRSRERFRIPPHLCVDCRAFSEGLGDIRIHYAGFAHPFFGKLMEDCKSENLRGAPLIFEVRGFSMDSMLRDGAKLAKVYFRRMSTPSTNPKDAAYSNQELKLSKVFKKWRSA